MSEKALIIFVRKPEKGKVKTRLAATIGDDHALDIYKELLRYTKSVVEPLKVDVFTFYADEVEEDDLWNGTYKKLQSEGNLGDKMYSAFRTALGRGYKKAVIIGSDCAELTTELIDKAFKALNTNEFVIGPAKDGGYYLLGMNRLEPSLFTDMPWSQPNLLEETLKKIDGKSHKILKTLSDIDDENDLNGVDWLRTYFERIKKR